MPKVAFIFLVITLLVVCICHISGQDNRFPQELKELEDAIKRYMPSNEQLTKIKVQQATTEKMPTVDLGIMYNAFKNKNINK